MKIKQLIKGLSFLYIGLLLVVYPFYFQNGYMNIGEAKYLFFIWVSLVAMVFLIPGMLFLKERPKTMTDYLMLGYLLVNLLSYGASSYKDVAFIGSEGWYLGLLSQGMFVFLYFVAKNTIDARVGGVPILLWLGILSAMGVYVLGILNRFSIYPFAMEGFSHEFISTLGSINWYAGYLSVALPIGIILYLFWHDKKGVTGVLTRIFLGLYCYLAFLTAVTQGSSSVFLIFLVSLLAVLNKAFDAKKWGEGVLKLGIFLGLALQSVRGLFLYNPPGMQYDSALIVYLMEHNLGIYLAIGSLLLYVAMHFFMPEYAGKESALRWKAGLIAVFVAFIIATFIVFIINTIVPGGIWPVREIGLFYFSDLWGNGRGGIWRDTWMAMKEMKPLQILFGVGPDCYGCFLYEFPQIVERAIHQFGMSRLTNAHNEILTTFVNLGLFGLFFYYGVLFSSVVSFIKKGRQTPLFYAFAVCIISYLIHNLVSFSQIISTPFLFLFMGMGQGLTNDNDSPNMVSICESNEKD